jgi:hypothetical protein
MGVSRSLWLVAEKIYTPQSPHNPPRNISQIERWSSQWNWVARCKDYDLDREAYLKDLEHYQLQQQAIGTAALNFTARSLRAIDYALESIQTTIERKGQLTDRQIDLLFTAQVAVKNLMGAATSAGDMTAKGLAVNELMSIIESEIETVLPDIYLS